MDVNRTKENGVSAPQDSQGKFVPTCPICGEKHWPHHPLAPCFNAKKVKEKAKAGTKAKAIAEKQARIDAKLQAKGQVRAEALSCFFGHPAANNHSQKQCNYQSRSNRHLKPEYPIHFL